MSDPAPGGRAEERKREEAPLDRILRVLNHPVRRRILRELADGPGSATTLSRQLGEELGLVSYHLNQVLAKDCRIVELVDSVARRGAIEKIYQLKFDGEPSFEEKFIVDVIAMDSPTFKGL
ncbi:MAG TPA: helix-turn-helix domain-containing protein [Solirubrobacterales bacterium]|nr:helix-turn-helix domain-containing protein [Solirubrobacterales bacterium]